MKGNLSQPLPRSSSLALQNWVQLESLPLGFSRTRPILRATDSERVHRTMVKKSNDQSQHPRRKPVTERPIRQTVRRSELRQIVPLSDTTIYELEQRGEFPQRFYLTPRCVVWDLAEVEAWIDERRRASHAAMTKRSPPPDVRKRRTRPVKGSNRV